MSALILSSFLLSAFAAAEPGNPSIAQEIQGKEAGTELPPVNLEYLMGQMLAANPELQAARKRWEAMQKRPGQESALPDPTVRFGWTSAGAPLSNEASTRAPGRLFVARRRCLQK